MALRKSLLLWPVLAAIGSVAWVNPLPESQHCPATGTVLQSLNLHNGGRFFYHESSPASPSSDAKIEFWSENELLWDADVTRSCSQGVGRCWLYVPYLVDGEPAGKIKSEWSEITLPNGQRLVVFSHLRDKITYLYFKTHAFDDVALQGASYNGTEYPRRQKMELPIAFTSVDCAS